MFQNIYKNSSSIFSSDFGLFSAVSSWDSAASASCSRSDSGIEFISSLNSLNLPAGILVPDLVNPVYLSLEVNSLIVIPLTPPKSSRNLLFRKKNLMYGSLWTTT